MDLRRALLACCLLLLAGLLAIGCGSDPADEPRDATPNTPDASETTTTEPEGDTDDDDGAKDDAAPAGNGSTSAALQVDVRETGSGAPSASLALACPVDHFANNDVRAACLLVSDSPDVITTPAETAGCTAVAGQPQTATISGTIDGANVDADFSRTDTCEIDRWNAVRPLFIAAGYDS